MLLVAARIFMSFKLFNWVILPFTISLLFIAGLLACVLSTWPSVGGLVGENTSCSCGGKNGFFFTKLHPSVWDLAFWQFGPVYNRPTCSYDDRTQAIILTCYVRQKAQQLWGACSKLVVARHFWVVVANDQALISVKQVSVPGIVLVNFQFIEQW